jgi:SAM-dependent methyltransferase
VIERVMTSVRLRALDARDRFGKDSDPLVPPRRRQFVGQGDFAEVGDEFLAHFVELAGLRPTQRVLDVGCGIGRMARPLTGFLDPARGSYEGFDVNPDGIAWCQERYAGRHPNFRFHVADLFNGLYRPEGGQAAAEYRFPFADGEFDLVFATSVFTHLLERESDRYLAESARVLRPGGRLFATFFLLDDESRERLAAGDTWMTFEADTPEEAVAYDVAWLRERLDAHGLALETLRPGAWSGREDGLTFQDVTVAVHA